MLLSVVEYERGCSSILAAMHHRAISSHSRRAMGNESHGATGNTEYRFCDTSGPFFGVRRLDAALDDADAVAGGQRKRRHANSGRLASRVALDDARVKPRTGREPTGDGYCVTSAPV